MSFFPGKPRYKLSGRKWAWPHTSDTVSLARRKLSGAFMYMPEWNAALWRVGEWDYELWRV